MILEEYTNDDRIHTTNNASTNLIAKLGQTWPNITYSLDQRTKNMHIGIKFKTLNETMQEDHYKLQGIFLLGRGEGV